MANMVITYFYFDKSKSITHTGEAYDVTTGFVPRVGERISYLSEKNILVPPMFKVYTVGYNVVMGLKDAHIIAYQYNTDGNPIINFVREFLLKRYIRNEYGRV